jgi:hypothetical protein
MKMQKPLSQIKHILSAQRARLNAAEIMQPFQPQRQLAALNERAFSMTSAGQNYVLIIHGRSQFQSNKNTHRMKGGSVHCVLIKSHYIICQRGAP